MIIKICYYICVFAAMFGGFCSMKAETLLEKDAYFSFSVKSIMLGIILLLIERVAV